LGAWIRAQGSVVWWLDGARVSVDDAKAIGQWLRAAPDLTLILATHAAIGLPGERVVPVGQLDPESAHALARDRRPDADPAGLARIVEAADGFPLALAIGPADPVDARAAVAGALDVAWSEIGEPAREAWEMMASVAAPVALREVEDLLGEATYPALDTLVRRGLVHVRRALGTATYELQASVRAYGLGRSGSDTWPARRLALALTDARPGPGALAELRRAASTLAAARVLAQHGEVDDAVLAGLATATEADDLLLRAQVRLTRGDPGGAAVDAGRAVTAVRGRPSEARIRARAGVVVARAGLLQGAAREAASALRQALAGVGPADHAVAAEGFVTLALLLRETARLSEAEEAVKQALHRARLAGNAQALARTQVVASTIWRHRGRLDAAGEALDQAESALEGGDLLCAHRERAILDLERGHPRSAREALRLTGEGLNRLGWRREAAESILGAAVCAWHDGHPGQAVDELTDAVHAMAMSGDRPGEGIALGWRAAALAALGDVEEAHVALAEATARLAPLDLPRARAVLHLAAAHVGLARGDRETATAALASASQVEASERAFGDEREMLRLLRLVTRPEPQPPIGP
jgi:tetratricopeptide (TPR) repeat protein